MHLFDAASRFYGGNAIVGGGLPIAVGLALADRMQGRRRVTACFFGEGAVAEGEFHESLNLAALWDLPVLFCCENNLYAMGTALERSESETDIALKAAALRDARVVGRRNGRARGRSGGAASGRSHPWRRRSPFPRVPHVSVPCSLHVRPRALPREVRGRSVEEARPADTPPPAARTTGSRRRRNPGVDGPGGRSRDRRRGRVRRSRDSGAGRPAHALRLQRLLRHDRDGSSRADDISRRDARRAARRAPARPSACSSWGRMSVATAAASP